MRFFPGPQGPLVRKICFWCGPAFAPEFAEPTLPVQIVFPLQGGRWHGEAVTDEGGFLKRAPTGFRWTVGTATSRPKAFPFRGRCPRRGRMRGTALIMQAVRFPWAAEGGGPYRRGCLMPRRAQAKRGATGAPGSSRPTNGAAFYRGIPAFQSHRSGPVCPPRLYRDTDHQGAHIGAPLRAFRQISAKTGAAPCGRPRADLGSAPTEKRKISAFRVGAGALTRPRRGVTGFDTPSPRK